MYEINFTTIGTTINSFFNLVGGILRVDPAAFNAVLNLEGGYSLALAILILGGISLGLGQSVVLFANRVPRRRFYIRLISSGLVLMLTILLWAGSIWLVAQILTNESVPFANVFVSAAISTAPLLFGFFVLLPYLGLLIFQILRIWAFFIYLNVIETSMGIEFWWALGLSLLGWILFELVTRFPLLQFERLRNWYWRVSTGRPSRLAIEDSVQSFIADLRKAIGMEVKNKDEGEN